MTEAQTMYLLLFFFILLPEAIADRKEIPTSLLVKLPNVRFLKVKKNFRDS